MDLNQATQKVQEAMQAAQTLAVRHGHQELDNEHLFLALLEQADGLAPRLLEMMGVPLPDLKARPIPPPAKSGKNFCGKKLPKKKLPKSLRAGPRYL